MLNQINYMLLDAARMGETIEKAKEINPEFDSLYRGGSEQALAVVAPYLFLFKQNTDFGNWYIQNGWGDAWGILIRSNMTMNQLHKHFRKFLVVGTENNQELYFRFYDPRVLRIFLPTCDQNQLREFFGPIEYFIMEDEDKGFAIRCWLENGLLRSIKIPIDEMVNNTFRFNAPRKTEPAPPKIVKENVVESKETKVSEPPAAQPPPPPPPKPEESKPKAAPNEAKKGDSKWKNFYFD